MTGMHHAPSIAIPASGTVVLEPGGFHVMLDGLRRDLVAGETVELELTFERAGPVTVDALVRAG
jgi:periplasmic copper chaperone A